MDGLTDTSSDVARRLWQLVPDGHWLYAILDGARDPVIVEKLCRLRPEFDSLYRGRAEQTLWEVAPYLVRLERETPFTQWLLQEGWGKAWGVYAVTTGDLTLMHRHLRKFLLVKGPKGENFYFRYYDPRVLRDYLPTCNRPEMATVFGPVASYLMEGKEPEIIMRFAPGPTQVLTAAYGPDDLPETIREPVAAVPSKSPLMTDTVRGPASPDDTQTDIGNSKTIEPRRVPRIQRVVLEITKGPARAKRVWLRPGQTLSVGRTDEADFAISQDESMSALHFELACDHMACKLRNRTQKSGTYLNGQPIAETMVRNRDEISAGHTTFVVHLETDIPESQSPAGMAPGAAPGESAPASALLQASLEITSGPYDGLTVDLAPDKPLVIGRLPDQGLSLPNDSSVSRRHCQVEFIPPECRVADLGSTYGTFVEGQKVTESRLTNGKSFRAGNSEFKVHIGVAAVPVRTLRIRKEQIDKLAEPKREDFKKRLALHLDEILPGKGIKIPADQLSQQIDEAIRRSKHYRVHRECDLAQYVEIVIVYLDGFNDKPHPLEARNILFDHRMTPEEKLAKLKIWAEGAASARPAGTRLVT